MSTFQDLWSIYRHEQGFAPATDADVDDETFIIAMETGHWIVIEEEPISETVLLKAVLAFLPLDDGDPANIYRRLLEAHLLGEATAGACFAIDPDAGELIAYRRLPVRQLDAPRLSMEIDGLATVAMRFAELLDLPAPANVVT